MTMLNDFLSTSATWGVLLTLAAFALGTLINHKTGKAVFNPLLLGTVFVIVFLSVCGIPYASYKASASPVSYLLLRKNVLAIVMGILAGTLASLGSVLVLSLLLRLDHSQYITLLPKSVTTAISMDVSKELGGIAALTGAIVILTGILGALMAETVCKVCHITHPIARGIGIGTAAHERPGRRRRRRHDRHPLPGVLIVYLLNFQ